MQTRLHWMILPLGLFGSLSQEKETPATEAPKSQGSQESSFKLAEWKERPLAKIQDREVKLGEVLDYIERLYAPGINKELNSPYGYFQIQSSDFDRWTDDFLDLQLLAPIAESKEIGVPISEVQAEAQNRAELEQNRYVEQKKLDKASGAAALPSLVARTLRNQGIAIEKQLLLNKLFPRPVSGSELRIFFTSNAARFGGVVQASQILFSTNDPKTGKRFPLPQREALKQSAQETLKKLREGSDFAELAKLYSDDTNSKSKGGDLGFFKRNTPKYPEPLTRAAFTTVPGEITFVETEQGYHILKVIERRNTKHPEFTQIRQEVEEDYLREKKNKFLEDLRKKASLQIY